MPTGPQPQNVLPVATGHACPRVLSPGAFCPSQPVTNCPRGLSPRAFRTSQRVANAHGAPPPARAARHKGSHMTTRPQPQRFPPVTQGYTRPRGPAPKRSASHNGSQASTGPHPQRVPLVTTGRKSPRGLSPSAFRPSQRVTNANGAHAPARSVRHNGSQAPTGPPPQRAPPVTTGHKCARGPDPSASLSSQRVTLAHGASAFCPSQWVANANRAPAPARSARHNGSQMPTGC